MGRKTPLRRCASDNGYTDAKGSPNYNLDLSQRRAQAVEAVLRTRLGAGYVFTTTGHGETDPIAPNTTTEGSDNPEGRALNRRVTIRYTLSD